ncbi:MAG: hypothetical protein CMA63_07725 [Euryarchaeota archaeon]|nr:hypothetical protein [Euryarchaeota archaeon]|tara:strand:- start:8759 stop:9301 length:543 start_codon:yes stop_codon:yes gene_type:complete
MIVIPALQRLRIDASTWDEVCRLASEKQIQNDLLLGVQERAARHHRWDVIYALSLLSGLETSVLIDANGIVSIDWGSPGRVALSPPIGCMAPFKLWVHTHPGFAAYWSGTDTNSLSIGTSIVESALVLGSPGIKYSHNASFKPLKSEIPRLSNQGPLQEWSDEGVIEWADWYHTLHEVRG